MSGGYLGGPRAAVLVRRDAHLVEYVGHHLGVDAAVVGHVLLAALVHVHRAHCNTRHSVRPARATCTCGTSYRVGTRITHITTYCVKRPP